MMKSDWRLYVHRVSSPLPRYHYSTSVTQGTFLPHPFPYDHLILSSERAQGPNVITELITGGGIACMRLFNLRCS